MVTVLPVTQLSPGAERATIARPTSSGVVSRFPGCFFMTTSIHSWLPGILRSAGVSTTPLADPAWDEKRARHLLGLLGLADKAEAWPDELSGGQQQRVAIARVMIGLPDLIIADEPTSALDRVSGRVVVDQLKDLAMRAKCAVVLSTHDERIFDVATRRLHIEDGRCFEVPIHYH